MRDRIPRQFELPVAFTSPTDPEYIPPAAHDAVIAEERRELPPGTLVLEQQYLGAIAARQFMRELAESGSHEDLKFGADIVSAALIGSARLSLRAGWPVMRRHLALPIVADSDGTYRDQTERVAATLEMLKLTTVLGKGVYEQQRNTGRVVLRFAHSFGRTAGEAGLWVAVLPHEENIGSATDSPYDIQHAVRRTAMDALEQTRRLGETLGANLSLATLGGPTTNLTAYVESQAPHGAYDAFHSAQSEVARVRES